MPDRHPLQEIKTFPSLVKYLRDELDWPIESDDFDDLTFDYEPEDLGIDAQTAAKIESIKQLRPLTTNQPWGIFFVKFEPLRLPVVALRKILGNLVIKKRASAKGAGQAAWKLHDLLFISAFGEGDDRQITLAHFSDTADGRDLPTLKVLGWDELDAHLQLKAVDRTLHDKLRWPADDANVEAWREQWSSAFTLRHRHVITTAEQLAERLAELAKKIRAQVAQVLAVESASGPLRKLYAAFQQALIHDLTEADFADMYAQTITYGLFSAAVSRTTAEAGTFVVADNLADMVPITNPFLKEMLGTFLAVGGRKGKLDFDELGIQNVVELLNSGDTDLNAVVRNFGDRRQGEDPVIHFYEDFLKQYDRQRKVERGVFYTPQPVVSYIVRSVHELLQTEFGLADGLADVTTWGELIARRPDLKLPTVPVWNEARREYVDQPISATTPFVQILDPATGTATFLVEVIDLIHKTMVAKWMAQGLDKEKQRAAWNEYVPKHLLPRLHGYELMMAPYAIAHMKLGLKLSETGYGFLSPERARIYLTNALEPAAPDVQQQQIAELSVALAHEAKAVNDVKRNQRFTVVIGNPPYANYSANLSAQARRIVDKYRHFRGVLIRERNQLQFERNIQDDFVKFISVAQDLIRDATVGVLGFITNGTMLASTSLRGLREAVTQQFSNICELNLHGGVNEIVVGGASDENVFDIAQAVAIHVYASLQDGQAPIVKHADLLGPRMAKYQTLSSHSIQTTEWQPIEPDAENCGFTPQDEASVNGTRRLDSLFVKFGAGIKTNRDAIVVGFDESSLIQSVAGHAPMLIRGKNSRAHIFPLLYRPFDLRKIFYHEDVVASRSLPTMKHIIAGPNLGFVTSSTWTTPDRFSVGVSQHMVEMKTGTHDRGTTFFPLYRYESLLGAKPVKTHNLTEEFIKEWCRVTQTSFVDVERGNGGDSTGPDDVFCWLYGLFYSPEYRRRYRAGLSQRFPIVLTPSNREVLWALVGLGRELVSLHLLESAALTKPMAAWYGRVDREVEKLSWSNNTVWIDKAQTRGFRGVAEQVWNFHIGGYQVCEKWLKDRKGRTLSDDDVAHYHKIVVALSETIRLMKEIDEVIDKHGGWPGAFATSSPSTDAAPPPEQAELPFA